MGYEFLSQESFLEAVSMALRWIMPPLAAVILAYSVLSLWKVKNPAEIWAYLSLPNGVQMPVTHWENTLGRAGSCDISLCYPVVSRLHAALTRDDRGSWSVTDLGSKAGTLINGRPAAGKAALMPGDILSLGGLELVFLPVPAEEKRSRIESRREESRPASPWLPLLFLTLFQALTVIELSAAAGSNLNPAVPLSFFGLCGVMWSYVVILRAFRRIGFEMEIIAFFLCTLNLAVVASSAPQALLKQFSAIILGILVFLLLGFCLRDLRRAVSLRYIMGGAAVLLFLINLLLGTAKFGAQNWLNIGGFSFQPSEFVKILFVYVGSATLERLYARRNLYGFIVFTGFCLACLALMGDFGTAAIFFVTFLVIAFLRSGDFATLSLICGGVGFAGILLLRFKPYIAGRFAAWGHVWEYASSSGYQQTRTMSAAASGGMIGVGAGKGWLKRIGAADTDLVFGMLCEEWGLFIALFAVIGILTLAVFAVRMTGSARSSFYTIAACAATSLLVFQTILNVFGSVDLLPLTGVTLPFLSNGGSSMVSAWGLLAFLKAADTRQNASFAIKLPSGRELRGAIYEEN